MRGQYTAVGGFAWLDLGFEHDGAGAVAEQDTGATVVPIENSGKRLGPDHQRALERARAQVTVRGGKREDKTRADRLQVEGGAVVDTELVLNGDRGRRKGIVRGRGCQHDQIDRL